MVMQAWDNYGTAWSVVHANLTEEIARQLVPKLRPKYLVLTEQRFVITPADEPERVAERRWPDVGVVPSGDAARQRTDAL